MKKGFTYALAAMVALPIISWGASSISGEVDGGLGGVATNFFVVGATVTLISGAGDDAVTVATTTTNDNGQYAFNNVTTTGFIQISVSADGYTPNPSTTVGAINADTNLTVNFVLLSSGSQAVPGTSSIGGQVTGPGALAGVQVTLRRRATNTSAYVAVDSTLTDTYGSYLFSNIAAAGASADINAYSLVVNVGGYNSFTSGNIAVADNVTVVSNIGLTVTALSQSSFDNVRQIRFSNLNGQLAMDLTASSKARTVEVFDLNGMVQNRVLVPANASRVMLSAAFAPEKGFLFRVK